ncbi:Protein kinase-like domain containing protein [Trema orientale]|uniref:Protein kinase-like domain containing protein n=1 Tax=Trema orientale TaxID=63057 RepID=A0A2P5FTA9_TREOI|nr:Protein kinase-like domain containing protein [Trema orientale]
MGALPRKIPPNNGRKNDPTSIKLNLNSNDPFEGDSFGRKQVNVLETTPRSKPWQTPAHTAMSFIEEFPKIHSKVVDLVEKMLSFDPSRKIAVEDAPAHPY